MNKETLNTYAELGEQDGITTLFRKFDTMTWIFQYKEGKCIGQVLLPNEYIDSIQNAPSLSIGDSETKQTI